MCLRCLSSVSVTTFIPTGHPAVTQPSTDAQFLILSEKNKNTKIPLKIHKGARITASAALADIIELALVGYDQFWERFTCFATTALSTSSSSNPQSRQSLSDNSLTDSHPLWIIGPFYRRIICRPFPCATDIRKMDNSMPLFVDVTAVVRIIASGDSVKTPTADLRLLPTEPVSQTLSVSEEEAMVAQKAFRPCSAGGVDGLRPGYLKDFVTPQTTEAGRRLLKYISKLCSKLLRSHIPQHARYFLFAAILVAFHMKDGGIRPIAVGTSFGD